MRRATDSRLGSIDLLKAVASQLIVLHHLAFYGPMAHHARPLAPGLIDWLDEHARIAVQVFLVVGGFMAARALSPHGAPGMTRPLRALWRRYLRVAPPYVVALGLAVAASALARTWMTNDAISAAPTVAQLLAHVALLQDVLGYEALSAGVWYIAIDVQLYALLSMLLWLAGRIARNRPLPGLVPALVTAGVAASLLHFNRDPHWDIWALYFFGSYGLGALAWWGSIPRRRPAASGALLTAALLLTIGALATDFRLRIAVALATAALLVATRRIESLSRLGTGPLAGFFGRISLALFLVHMPVCLAVSAAFTRFAGPATGVQAAGALLAWVASITAAAAFHRWVEVPLSWLGRAA